MTTDLERIVRARIKTCEADIAHSLQMVADGNPYAAETDNNRMLDRVQAKAWMPRSVAESFVQTIQLQKKDDRVGAPRATMDTAIDTYLATRESHRTAALPSQAEKILGDTLDFVSVAFLAKGAQTARSVGRVSYRDGRPQGSGFLIGNGLFLTNHHVIEDEFDANQFVLDFDYELDLLGRPRSVSRFNLDPVVFLTDPIEGLDFTIVAVGSPVDGPEPIEAFSWSGLSAASDKHMLGEFANIVQHPQGRFKEVVLRENRLVSRFDNALHYVGDTEPGSSGSPVFNSQWQVIALHHWGGPWIRREDDQGNPVSVDINEGIRISAIVKNVRSRLMEIEPVARQRLAAALEMGEQALPEIAQPARQADGAAAANARIDPDGRVTWTIPLEISVNLPTLSPGALAAAGIAAQPPKIPAPGTAERRRLEDYSKRGGYKPGFLEGHTVPLPELDKKLLPMAAVNRQAETGDNRHELKYHHFSVVMNGKRKLAFFTACNIDGASAKSIHRKDRSVSPLSAGQAGLESAEAADGAEAGDSWYRDSRLDRDEYAGPEIYSGQRVPGFSNPQSSGRIARMFQRGHLVRRLDPAWGPDKMALAAERDTFHWTNCSPQVGFFNQGTASASLEGSGGGRLWRTVENYVLRNAVAENQRVTCFTGPIFDDAKDRAYRTIKIPGRFFKIVVWVQGQGLRSLAMIADQRPVFSAWPEALFSEKEPLADAAEAFQDPDELEKVEDFLSTVKEVEELTGLKFGDKVRRGDVRKGASGERIKQAEEIVLARPRRRRAGKKRVTTRGRRG